MSASKANPLSVIVLPTACDVDLNAAVAVTYAAGFLRDSALTWYRNHLSAVQRGVALPYTNWEVFKVALITHFTPISLERTARQKLDTLQQGSKPARTYAEQFNLCMRELPDMNEKDRVHRFLAGLRPEVRIHVELKSPVSLSDAVELAIKADSLMWQTRKQRFVPMSSNFQPFSHQQQPAPRDSPTPMELGAVADARRIDSSNSARRQEKSKQSKSAVRCYYCRRLGHYQRNCPKRAADLAMMSDAASPQQSN
jgi:hypothetical protein